MVAFLDNLSSDFDRLFENGYTFTAGNFEVVLDANIHSEVELGYFAVYWVEKKHISVENLLLYFDFSNDSLALGWSGVEYSGTIYAQGNAEKFTVYIRDAAVFNRIMAKPYNLVVVDCLLDYSKFGLNVCLETENISDYNFVNDNQEMLIYEFPVLKKYLFNNENFEINFNSLKSLSFKSVIKYTETNELLKTNIPVKLGPNVSITVLPPVSKTKEKRYNLCNRILDHNKKTTVYLPNSVMDAIAALGKSVTFEISYAGRNYLVDRAVFARNDLLLDSEICVNFMSCLSVNLQVSGAPGRSFQLLVQNKEESTEKLVNSNPDDLELAVVNSNPDDLELAVVNGNKDDSETAVVNSNKHDPETAVENSNSEDPEIAGGNSTKKHSLIEAKTTAENSTKKHSITEAEIENPALQITLPKLEPGLNILIYSSCKTYELSKIRFQLLIGGKQCIYFDTPFLLNLIAEKEYSVTDVLNKYILGIDTGFEETGSKSSKGDTIFSLLKLLFKKICFMQETDQKVVVLITSSELFLPEDSDGGGDLGDNGNSSKKNLSYLKLQKLFLETKLPRNVTLLLQFGTEDQVPAFFNELLLVKSVIKDVSISYKRNVTDYRDFLNVEKISDHLEYTHLHNRKKNLDAGRKETSKPLYGLHKIIVSIKNIYETPFKYSKLYTQFPKTNQHLLLYGSPSMGKSLIIRHLPSLLQLGENTSWKYVNALSLISKYTGESERNVREMFAEARQKIKNGSENSAASEVYSNQLDDGNKVSQKGNNTNRGMSFIVIDNIQTLLPTRSSTATITDRLVNTFLTELDGIDSAALNDGLVVIGVTNRPDQVDPAVLRPGRLENRAKISHSDVDWKEVVRSALKDYMDVVAQDCETVDAIVDLVSARKSSIGQLLGAFYELKLGGVTSEEEILRLLGANLADESEDFYVYERYFAKFENKGEHVAVGVESAFM